MTIKKLRQKQATLQEALQQLLKEATSSVSAKKLTALEAREIGLRKEIAEITEEIEAQEAEIEDIIALREYLIISKDGKIVSGNKEVITKRSITKDPILHIAIPKGVEVIDQAAFFGLKIEEITLPKSIKEIKERAFCDCIHLRQVFGDMDSNLEKVGEKAFFGCSSLMFFSAPKTLRFIEAEAFANSNLGFGFQYLGKNIDLIGKEAFAGSRIPEVDIDGTPKQIMQGAFKDCVNLRKADIGNYAISDIESLFSGCDKLDVDKLNEYQGYVVEEVIRNKVFEAIGEVKLPLLSPCMVTEKVESGYEIIADYLAQAGIEDIKVFKSSLSDDGTPHFVMKIIYGGNWWYLDVYPHRVPEEARSADIDCIIIHRNSLPFYEDVNLFDGDANV